ncbi:MAG: redoxin domain-containing protein [Lachnospiraceae bacterium]|nr:redoxin domain-containing protein [Lachnospiraceae bacterium]
MACHNCGAPVDKDTTICPVCGAEITAEDKTSGSAANKNKNSLYIALIAGGIILVAIVFAVIFLSPSRRLENALESARNYAAHGYYDRAEQAYEKALDIDEYNLEAHMGLLDVYMETGDYMSIFWLYYSGRGLHGKDSGVFEDYAMSTLESGLKEAIKQEDEARCNDIFFVYYELCKNEYREPNQDLIDEMYAFLDPESQEDEGGFASSPGGSVGAEYSREELGERYGYGYYQGAMIPDLTFYDQNGNLHSISEFQGKAVYINFFTTWCTYCLYELPDMQEIADEFAGDAVVIMIDLGEGPELGTQYAEDYDVDLPIYYVDGWVIENDFTIDAVPFSVIIDRRGMVCGNHLGQADYEWMQYTMENAVNAS